MDENHNGASSLFSFLPEGCISNIISLTSPTDACTASVISVGFKSASESDTVWDKFLPSDYQEIILNSISPLNYASKKELYFHLCHSPILINNGTLSFWLRKSTGQKCYMLPAKELSTAWKYAPRSWSWTSLPESRFSEVAELQDNCWFIIQGKMQNQMLSLKTNYAAYLVFNTTDDPYGLEILVKASVGFAADISTSTSSSRTSNRSLVEPNGDSVNLRTPTYVNDLRYERRMPILPIPILWDKFDRRVPHQRNDGWLEIFLGEFFSDEHDGCTEIKISKFSMLRRKRGLILEGIEIRPKEDA